MVSVIPFPQINTVIRLISIGTLFVTSLSAQRQPQKFVEIAEDFSQGSGGWLAEFTNYNFSEAGQQRLAEIRALPAETEPQRNGYYLQAINHSDDIFSFLKRPLEAQDGIEPGASYEVEFLIEFASNAPTGCVGVGGSPGDAVYLKVGASALEPVSILVQEGLRLNLDKGSHANSGSDATLAGTIANGLECTPENQRFVLIERRQAHAGRVTASSGGTLWVFVGTDSGYEGLNQLYYARIVVSLTRVDGDPQ
jgi:hypothetical protein